MIQFTYKLKLNERVGTKCSRSDSETRICCQPPILRVAAKGGSESAPGWALAVRQYKVYKTLAAFLKHDSCIGVRRNAYYINK
jgi:hypothetical protein